MIQTPVGDLTCFYEPHPPNLGSSRDPDLCGVIIKMALMLSKLQKTCEMFESILEDIALPTAAASSKLENNVYGRICSSVNKDISPQFLSDTANGRKTVFVFGYDGVSMILHQPSTFDALLKLGFTKDYIHYEVLYILFSKGSHVQQSWCCVRTSSMNKIFNLVVE